MTKIFGKSIRTAEEPIMVIVEEIVEINGEKVSPCILVGDSDFNGTAMTVSQARQLQETLGKAIGAAND